MSLSGETDNVPAEELHAVMFAQHYADTEGNPSQIAWEKLIKEYGTDRAYGILGTTRMIMFGNTYGISLGNVKNSFSKNKPKQSSLISNLTRTLSIVVLLPTAIIHALINRLIIKEPLITFDQEAQLQ